MITITALALAAYNLAKPFLEKTGEGVARKVGEDIWNLIKKPFQDDGHSDIESLAITDETEFKTQLEQKLFSDENLKNELSTMVQKAEFELSGNFQQNINSYGDVEKQINIQTNSGNIQM